LTVEYGPQLQLCLLFRTKGNGAYDLGIAGLSREANMKYATLGNTGLLVSKLCLGTMTSSPRPSMRRQPHAEAVARIDLSGSRVIVSGGTSGIGVETARALAATGAEVTP
jgi:hypothetical protein